MNSECQTLYCVRFEQNQRSFLDRLAGWFKSAGTRRESAANERELRRLGDHLLRDIGLDPDSLAMNPAARDGVRSEGHGRRGGAPEIRERSPES